MIGIRVDGNEIVGLGHVQRCLAIAKKIELLGVDALFFVTDKQTKSFIHSKGFACVCIEGKFDCLEKETEEFSLLLKKNSIKVLLLDTYYITLAYLQIISAFIQIVYIDDLNHIDWEYDLLVNYSVYSIKMYYRRDIPKLLGCRYVPLREEFEHTFYRRTRKEIKNILVLTGGTDPFGFGLNFWKQFCIQSKIRDKLSTVQVNIVCGTYNHDFKKLRALEHTNPNLKIVYDCSNISDYMMRADVAVSAGGVTLYELCACGLPSISYSFVDNQMDNVKGFHENGIIAWCGDLRDNFSWINLFDNLNQIAGSTELRQEISRKMQNLVDGKGAERIAEAMIKLLTKKLY